MGLHVFLKIFDHNESMNHNSYIKGEKMVFRGTSLRYDYLLLPDVSKCSQNRTVMTAMVLTTPERSRIRQAIRKSWASPAKSAAIQNGYVAVFFVSSAPKSEKEMAILRSEHEDYGDLLVTSLEESYENLVLKVYAMMNFFLKHCSKSASLIKTDDDVSIHLDRMLEKWKHLDDSKIFCRLWRGHEPLRDPASKWYISRKLWPRKTYPDYCDGPFYVIRRAAVKAMLEVASHFKPFPMEDVFYTGILSSAASLSRVDWRREVIAVNELTWKGRIACEKPEVPVSFAISSFSTANGLQSAFEGLRLHECLYSFVHDYEL